MSFENVIAKISQIAAAAVIFLIANGFYLSQKGFSWIDGGFVLVSNAQAKEVLPDTMSSLVKAEFDVPDARVLGDKNAPITIYEFSSLGCSHCADFHLSVLPELEKNYINEGKLKLVFADFPIDAKSMQASMLAKCMPEDKYFDFIKLLFKKQMTWGMSFKSEKLLTSYAEMEGLSAEKAAACLKDDAIAKEIMYTRQQGMEKLQIQGTPSFLIKKGNKQELLHGLPSYEKIQEILNNI